VLPALAALSLDLNLFYEIKANITRDQAFLLAKAGVKWVQPGIESFSTRVLKLMRKGLTSLQNIMLLRLCREFAITPSYNILVGFPGEKEDDYLAMAQLLRKVFHLSAPSGKASLVQVHRFSPFHYDSDRLGVGEFQPAWSYRHLIPPDILDPGSYAYFFDRPGAERQYANNLGIINEVVREWQASGRRIYGRLGPGNIEMRDSKYGVFPLSPAASVIMIAADRPRGKTDLLRIAAAAERNIEPEEVLHTLIDRDWLVADADQIVSTVPFERPHDQASLETWSRRWLIDPTLLHRD